MLGQTKWNYAVVLWAIVLGAGVALLLSSFSGERHRAEVDYVVTPTGENKLVADEIAPLVRTLSSTFESRRIASEAVSAAAPGRSVASIRGGLSMRSEPDSLLLVGSYEDDDALTAMTVLQAASDAFLASVSSSGLSSSADGEPRRVSVEVFAPPASLPDPVSRPLALMGALGGLLGLILGLGYVALRSPRSGYVESLRSVEEIFGTSAIDLTGLDVSDRGAEVLRSLAVGDPPGPVLVASLPGAGSARRRLVEAAVGGLETAGWQVDLASIETDEGGSVATREPAMRLDLEVLTLATPGLLEQVRSDVAELRSRSDLVIFEFAAPTGRPPAAVAEVVSSILIVMVLGSTRTSDARALAADMSGWDMGVSRVAVVDPGGTAPS